MALLLSSITQNMTFEILLKTLQKILTFTINAEKLTRKIINLKISLNSIRIALQRHYRHIKTSAHTYHFFAFPAQRSTAK